MQVYLVSVSLAAKGNQNRPLENVLLWHKDYRNLEAMTRHKVLSAFSPCVSEQDTLSRKSLREGDPLSPLQHQEDKAYIIANRKSARDGRHDFTKITLVFRKFPLLQFFLTIYHPLFIVSSLFYNLLLFVKVLYAPLPQSLTTSLSLYFFSPEASVHVKVIILTLNEICMPVPS